MAAMVAASYAVDSVLLALFVLAGTIPAMVAVAYGAAGALATGLQWASYRGGWSERFHDSYLAAPFVLVHAGVSIASLWAAPAVGFMFISVLFVICAFGALRLTRREFVVVCTIVAVAAGAAFAFAGQRPSIPGSTPAELFLSWLVLALTLGRCFVVGLYGSAIRGSLDSMVRRRTAELTTALREVESLSYTISHHMRAPARAVNAAARMIEIDHGNELTEAMRSLVGRIADVSTDMGAMVDGLIELLHIARAEPVRRTVDITGEADAVWDALAAAGVVSEARFEAEPGLSVTADPEMLRRLLHLLLENACKFTHGRPGANVWFGRRADGAIFVRDNGVGFDAAYSDKLFHPFEHLHRAGEFKGYGLGLALARRIVERHGGRIWAESAPGAGSTFFFTLP
ncbi:MAG: hypothetical protein HY017_10195 [Betaproteobacteria bacterium]|nr:hypothetical protein [Betaproteobacteria bacterium]